MKKTLFAFLVLVGVNALAGFRALTAQTITCTATRPLFEGELTVRIEFQNKTQGRTAAVTVSQLGRNISIETLKYSMRPANLRYDLFGGRIVKDSEGNYIYDGIMMSIDTQDSSAASKARVFLAFNRASQNNDMYVLVDHESKLTLPRFGEFAITSCR